jgi:hypothetical protein
MKRLRIAGALLTALFALAVAFASSASAALPQILPEKPAGTKGTSTITSLITLAGTTVTCQKNKDEFEFTETGRLGPFHINFEECTTKIGVVLKCTGTGDPTGVILALGTFHLVYDHLGTGSELGVGILFLLSPTVVFTCTSAAKVEVTGEILCLVTPVATSVAAGKPYTVKCEQKAGDQIEHYWNDTPTEKSPVALAKLNEGVFESAAEEGKAELTSTEKTEIMG